MPGGLRAEHGKVIDEHYPRLWRLPADCLYDPRQGAGDRVELAGRRDGSGPAVQPAGGLRPAAGRVPAEWCALPAAGGGMRGPGRRTVLTMLFFVSAPMYPASFPPAVI